MNVIDAIKLRTAQAGGRLLGTVSSINPQLGGALGKAVDFVGKKLGNPLPEVYASERAESAGGYDQQKKIQEDPNLSATEKAKKIQELNKSATERAGFESAPIDTSKLNPGGSYQSNWRDLALKEGRDVNSSEFASFRAQEEAMNATKKAEDTFSPSDVSGAIAGSEGAGLGFLNEGDFNAILEKYSGSSRSNSDALAREIEDTARRNAEEEYRTVLDALGGQKKEVEQLSKEQKERLAKEKGITVQELESKQQTELQSIEKQKTGFEQEVVDTKEELARNWKDMSLEVQRIMRSRGVSDSSFAASTESKVLLDFNKGLKKIALQSDAAVKDFADAVTENMKFYEREKVKLENNYTNALSDIDTWVRQQVTSIQNQENVALNKKLSDIRNAISQGNQLKIQTEQKIADQQASLGMWLAQYQAQLKAAVAIASAGKVEDAWNNISSVRQNADIVKKVLENGGEILSQKDKNGNITGGFVHGYLPNADGTYQEVSLPITGGFAKTELLQQAANITQKAPGDITQITKGSPSTSDVYSYLTGGGNNPYVQPTSPVNAIKEPFFKLGPIQF